ncbi:MAG: hypothetical protein KC519_23445, partial [Anaerolineae bacterium]|nr:hypothetical protein [Anaerolineae bacterium]
YQEMGNRQAEADMWATLGHAAFLRGDTALALGYFGSSFRFYLHVVNQLNDQSLEQVGQVPYHLNSAFIGTALIAIGAGNHERATILLGQVSLLHEGNEQFPEPVLHKLHEQGIAALRAHLGDDKFDRLWAAGRGMPFKDALEIALGDTGAAAAEPAP